MLNEWGVAESRVVVGVDFREVHSGPMRFITGHIRKGFQAMNSRWCYVWALLLLVGAPGCSSTNVQCGGKISPAGIDGDALVIAKKAMAESAVFCEGSPVGCDYVVAKVSNGWSVAATRVFVVENDCASRVGDEKIYSYDDSGDLIRVIDGL